MVRSGSQEKNIWPGLSLFVGLWRPEIPEGEPASSSATYCCMLFGAHTLSSAAHIAPNAERRAQVGSWLSECLGVSQMLVTRRLLAAPECMRPADEGAHSGVCC